MRNIKICLPRLYTLAEHLNNKTFKKYSAISYIKIADNVYYTRWMNKGYSVPPWILYELPFLYSDDWSFTCEGHLVHNSFRRTSSQFLFLEYFGLEIKEFTHIFCLYSQTYEYRGKEINEKSQPKDTAENIYAFLYTILENLEANSKIASRKVFIEKNTQLRPSIWLANQLKQICQ